MTGLRGWVLLLALTSAAAGFAAGLFVHGRLSRRPVAEGPFGGYERLFVERFELSPERARLFQAVLASYNHEIEGLKDRQVADSMSAMEPELVRLGAKYRDLIRNRVLPPEKRAEFDRLVAGGAPLAPEPEREPRRENG
jgi:hypothetical protein